eukprot:TRINITY_DN64230_c0_g1_i1.p1 TRINITY_DN64230_c0_g1~~TRINITY_DN64230_c0_g1_i1.p1  ORF type:complete len:347 (-),score=72.22 TRINITY_DN64230_c0_g1_i1:37-1047(-)
MYPARSESILLAAILAASCCLQAGFTPAYVPSAKRVVTHRRTPASASWQFSQTESSRESRAPEDCSSFGIVAAAALASIVVFGNAAAARAKFMDCGGAPLCGVLALETGLGTGAYKKEVPVVHGLWPQVGTFGTSKCIRPTSSDATPKQLYSCYSDGKPAAQLGFERHEWEEHGTCAGVKDAEEYFQEVCGLSKAPLEIMAAERAAGDVDLGGYAKRLEAAGYPVFATDVKNMQVSLSACAKDDGQWLLAKPSEFATRCGGKSVTVAAAKAPEVKVAASSVPKAPEVKLAASTVPLDQNSLQCKLNQKGPACKSDADCGYSGCVRCAKSGFCTAQP